MDTEEKTKEKLLIIENFRTKIDDYKIVYDTKKISLFFKNDFEIHLINLKIFNWYNSIESPNLKTFLKSYYYKNKDNNEIINNIIYYAAINRYNESDINLSFILFCYYNSIEKNIEKLHFNYNYMCEILYRNRNVPYFLNECIEVCKRDIYIIINAPTIPNLFFPCFKKLITIYDKTENYDKAIELCELAIHLRLNDGTKSGYIGLLDRLVKKSKK